MNKQIVTVSLPIDFMEYHGCDEEVRVKVGYVHEGGSFTQHEVDDYSTREHHAPYIEVNSITLVADLLNDEGIVILTAGTELNEACGAEFNKPYMQSLWDKVNDQID